MKVLIMLAMFLFLSSLQTFASEMKDKSGLPVVLSVGNVLNKKQSDLVGWRVSVKGFLFYEEKDEIAYLFENISDVIAFENENAVIIEVPNILKSVFKKRHLCHVVLQGGFKKNGLSTTNVVMHDITYLTLLEVFSYELSEQEMDDYTCVLQKIIQSTK